MMCKQCSDQIGQPAEWHPHNKLEKPGSARTSGYRTAAYQKLYACKDCQSVLRRGQNTGWALAVEVVRTEPEPDIAAAVTAV